MTYFTADEHYGHKNVIDLCNRPFASLAEMEEVLVANNNAIVQPEDVVYHLGDFSFYNVERTQAIIRRLTGQHIFLQGNHDRWAKNTLPHMIIRQFDKTMVAMGHYAQMTWAHKCHGSIHLYGHSHNKLIPICPSKMTDVGVDANDFRLLSIPAVLDKLEHQAEHLPKTWRLV